MAVVFQSKTDSTSTLAGGDPLVLTKPSGTVDGNLLIAVIGLMGNETSIDSPPAGWTLIESRTGNSGEETLYAYYKVASSEPASWDWGRTGSDAQALWAVLRFEGQASSSIINADNSASVTNDSTPSFANGITPTTANSLLVLIVGTNGQAGTGVSDYAVTTSNPALWTEHVDLTATSGSGIITNVSLAIASATRAETTDTGNSLATLGGGGASVDSTAILFAVTPAPPQAAAPNADVLTATFSLPTPGLIIPASPSPAAVEATITIPAFTPQVVAPDWTNPDKTTAPSWTNPDKS